MITSSAVDMSVDEEQITDEGSGATEVAVNEGEAVGGVGIGDHRVIPLCMLVSAGEHGNVRTERNESITTYGVDGRSEIEQKGDVVSMADTLADVGQLFNLIVYPVGNDKYAVADGETRRLGMLLNVKRNVVKKDHPMRVLVCKKNIALMLSWVANEKRRPIGLADRFSAYTNLIEGGMSVEKLAEMNDVPVREVERILQLGKLHPAVMNYLKKEGMGIEVAIQFAKASSQELQLQVFNALGGGKRTFLAHEVRNLVSKTRISTTSATARFITVKGYEKAGGELVGDLFSNNEAEMYMDDMALVNRLVAEKFARLSKKHGKGYAWVECIAYGGQSERGRCEVIPMSGTNAPEEFEEQLRKARESEAQLDELVETLSDKVDGEGGEGFEQELDDAKQKACAAGAEVRQLEKALNDKYRFHTDDERAFSGVVISFDYKGTTDVLKGAQTTEDRKRYQNAVASGNVEAPQSGSNLARVEGASKGLGKFGRDMSLRRRSVARVALAKPGSVEVARTMLEFVVCSKVFCRLRHSYAASRHVAVDVTCVNDETSLKDQSGSRAFAELANLESDLSWGWFEEECATKRLELFSKLPKKKREAIVSYCVAMTMEACETADNDLPEAMMAVLSPDPVTNWRPCRDSYFRHMSKAALYELGVLWYGQDSSFAVTHAKSTKTVLLDAICRVFENDPSALSENELVIRDGWVPDEMSF